MAGTPPTVPGAPGIQGLPQFPWIICQHLPIFLLQFWGEEHLHPSSSKPEYQNISTIINLLINIPTTNLLQAWRHLKHSCAGWKLDVIILENRKLSFHSTDLQQLNPHHWHLFYISYLRKWLFLTNWAPAASQLALEWKCKNVVWI